MAYVSPQVEGRIKRNNTWACQNCSFNENSVNLAQCQYCGFMRAASNAIPMPIPQPIIQPTNVYIPAQPPAQPYPQQQFIVDSKENSDYYIAPEMYQSQPQQPTITQNITVNVNHNTNNNNNKQPQKENYNRFTNEQYEVVDDEYEYEQENEQISCGCAMIRLLLWFTICGGLVTAIWWFVCACIFMVWFKPCFIISRYLLCGLCSKDNNIKIKTKCKCYDSKGKNEKNCCCDICFTLIWLLIFGIPSTVIHVVFGILSTPFLMCGFKFAAIHFRVAKIALFNPCAVEIMKQSKK